MLKNEIQLWFSFTYLCDSRSQDDNDYHPTDSNFDEFYACYKAIPQVQAVIEEQKKENPDKKQCFEGDMRKLHTIRGVSVINF